MLSPSIVYAPGDRWLTLLRRLTHLPWLPVSGERSAALPADLGRGRRRLRGRSGSDGRATDASVGGSSWPGPEVLSYDDIVRLAMEVENGAAAR